MSVQQFLAITIESHTWFDQELGLLLSEHRQAIKINFGLCGEAQASAAAYSWYPQKSPLDADPGTRVVRQHG